MQLRPFAFALVASLAAAALADGPAVTLTGSTIAETSNVLLGWTFTPRADVYVTGLGYVDLGPDGMIGSHKVGILEYVSGSLVTQATLAAGTGSTKLGDFRYALADGAKLTAGKRYIVVGTDDSDPWTTDQHASASFASEIVPDGRSFFDYGVNTLGVPSQTYVYAQYFGPSFTFSTQAVPEPASMAALGLGAVGMLRRRRLRA